MNRRISVLVSIVLLAVVLATALPTFAQGGVVVVANANLNLRAAPDGNSQSFATVPWETQLTATALSPDRNWVAVVYNGQGGWLSLAYTGEVSGSLGSLPISNQVFVAGGGSGGPTSSVIVVTTINLRYRFQPTLDVQPAGAIPYQTQVPAFGLSADGLFVLVNYNGQDVWVYREYVQEVVGSLTSFVPGAAPSASTVGADLLGVCSGGSAPDATPYGGPAPHPVMVINAASGSLHGWNNQLGAWTTSNPAQIQLVACVGQEVRIEIQECFYNGPSIHRYVFQVPVQLRAATTGQVIATTTLTGAPPRECRQTEPYYLVTLEGTHVSFSDLQGWLSGYVN